METIIRHFHKSLSVLFIGLLMTGCQEDILNPTDDIENQQKEAESLTTKKPSSNRISGSVVEEIPLASVEEGIYFIVNKNSGKVLDVSGASYYNGANIIQYTNYKSENQKWYLKKNNEGYYTIISLHSGKCLDVAHASTSNGANVSQWHDWKGYNQQWSIISTGGGYYRIMNRNSGKALDIAGASTTNSANLAQWSYWGGSNQQWSFTKLGSGSSNGQLTWSWTTTGMPEDAADRISVAMDAACIRYNNGLDLPYRNLTVEYNTSIPTADANIDGHIRFGGNTTFQNQRTALHEIAHTCGVGQSSGFYNNESNGIWTGSNTVSLIKSYDGQYAVINTNGSHFWPYGLNYNNEMTELNAQRHVQIIKAMKADGM